MTLPGEILRQIQSAKKLLEHYGRNICVKHGLSQTGLDILMFLYNNPDTDTAKDIVELRMLPKANVSKAVEALIHRGFLRRVQDAGDRRLIHLILTEEAQKIMPDIIAVMNAFASQLFKGFTPEQQALYAEMNTHIAQNAIEGLERK